MGQRKVDLVIVEGLSEETALGAPLSAVLSDSLVKILVMYGDITTKDGVEPGNVTAKIWDNVKAFVKGITGIKLGDLRQIIHIVDIWRLLADDSKEATNWRSKFRKVNTRRLCLY